MARVEQTPHGCIHDCGRVDGAHGLEARVQYGTEETWLTRATLYRNPPPAEQPRDSYPANTNPLLGLPFISHGNNVTMTREFF